MSEKITVEQAINVMRKYTDTDSGISEVVAEAHRMAIAALKQSCKTCKHYTAGEHDGACGSYICKDMSDWEEQA